MCRIIRIIWFRFDFFFIVLLLFSGFQSWVSYSSPDRNYQIRDWNCFKNKTKILVRLILLIANRETYLIFSSLIELYFVLKKVNIGCFVTVSNFLLRYLERLQQECRERMGCGREFQDPFNYLYLWNSAFADFSNKNRARLSPQFHCGSPPFGGHGEGNRRMCKVRCRRSERAVV